MKKEEEHEIGQKIAMALSDIDPKFIDEAATVPAVPSKGKLSTGRLHRYGLVAACLALVVAFVSAGALLRMGMMGEDESNDMSYKMNAECGGIDYAYDKDGSMSSEDESIPANSENRTEASNKFAEIVTSTVTTCAATEKVPGETSSITQGTTSSANAEAYYVVESKETFDSVAKKMKDGTSSVGFLYWLDKETGVIHNVSLSYKTDLLEIPSSVQGVTISGIDGAALSASVAEMDGITSILIPDSVKTITGVWNTGNKVITVMCPSGCENLIQYFLAAGCRVEKY